jgi:hypothetical protein
VNKSSHVAKVYEYRSLSRLGHFLGALIVLYVVIKITEAVIAGSAISLMRDLTWQSSLFHSSSGSQMMLVTRGKQQALAGTIELLVGITTNVISCIWLYRAACNVRVLGAKGLEDTPGWVVGWFFVPVANLVKPFQAVSQIFLASNSPASWQSKSTPPSLYVWWALWQLGNFYIFGVLMYTASLKSLDGMIMKSWLLLGGNLLQALSSLMFLAVVLMIVRAQERQNRKLV